MADPRTLAQGASRPFYPEEVRKGSRKTILESARDLRPFQPGEYIDNLDGTWSTERTVTLPAKDGSWINAPSLWMGPKGPIDFGMNEDAIADMVDFFERKTGLKFPRYKSAEEGTAASKARSSHGGVFGGGKAAQ